MGLFSKHSDVKQRSGTQADTSGEFMGDEELIAFVEEADKYFDDGCSCGCHDNPEIPRDCSICHQQHVKEG